MQAAVISGGVVANIIEVESLDFMPGLVAVGEAEVGIGWLFDGQQFTPPPAPPFDLDAAWERIKAIRDRKTQQGGYLAAGKWFHSDTFSRTQQIGLTIMGASVPPGLMWKTMDGTFVEMTPTLAQQVFAAAGQQDAALFAYAEQLRAQVNASADPASIDLEAGWPATYGGV